MTHSVMIYGFGSAFAEVAAANDADLLIIHPNTDAASCEFAIKCKQRLVDHIAHAHVTILSASEEAHFRFINRARAFGLGSIRERYMEADFEAVHLEIRKRIAQTVVGTM